MPKDANERRACAGELHCLPFRIRCAQKQQRRHDPHGVLVSKRKQVIAMPIPMHICVYKIPGGEVPYRRAFDELESLLETNPNLPLAVYGGQNQANGDWVLTLIGEPSAFTQCQDQIQPSLTAVQATLLQVPLTALRPLIARFEARQAEMRATGVTFLTKHFPLPKSAYAKPRTKRPAKKSKRKRR